MIRTTLLFVSVIILAGYARRDWFVPLCGTLLMAGIVQHPDMPKTIFGVQGLNAWNLLMGSVMLSWLSQRKSRKLNWDMPVTVTLLLIAYGLVIAWAFSRMMQNRAGLETLTTAYLVSEDLINCLKWILPGLILFDTCRTRKQVVIALLVVLAIYLILAIQVIHRMPLSYAMSGDDLSYRASKIVEREVGYNRVNMSMMLSGASWAMVGATVLFRKWRTKGLILACSLTVILAQVLTAGRMGYVTWVLLGVTLCTLRWLRALPIIPILAAAIVFLLPGVRERLFDGFAEQQGAFKVVADQSEITSGRTVIWPYVIDRIAEAPILGYGRRAMVRTGLSQFLQDELNEDFPHPHNAYLEMLLDNGALGLLIVLPFYGVILWRSLSLFRDRLDNLAASVGGATLALVLALLIAAVGSQTFYPREGSVGMWAAIGLMLRVSVEKRKALAGDAFVESPEDAGHARAIAVTNLNQKLVGVSSAARGRWTARRRRHGLKNAVRTSSAGESSPDSGSRFGLRAGRQLATTRRFRKGIR